MENDDATIFVPAPSDWPRGAGYLLWRVGDAVHRLAVGARGRALAPRGRVVEVGHFTDPGATEIRPHIVCFKDLDIRGMWAYPAMQFKTALSFLKNTKAPLEKFITHRLPLESITEGIDITGSEGSMKVVIEPGA